MRIVILTAGSLGDVRPYVALGAGLRAAGHDVTIAGYSSFRALVVRHGLAFKPLRNPFSGVSRPDAWAAWQASGGRPLTFAIGLGRLLRAARARATELFDDGWRACRDADAVVYPTAGLGGPDIADKLRIRGYWAHLYPVARTAAFPCFLGPAVPLLERGYNRFTYRVASAMYRRVFGPTLDTWRRESLGMPPRGHSGTFDPFSAGRAPVVYGFSPTLVPRPHDWGSTHHVTGYWYLDEPDTPPPAALDTFLRAGPPPLYLNARSLGLAAPFIRSLAAAVPRATGRRLIVQTADDVDTGHADVLTSSSSLPHDWLFPRVCGIVHHGGAGTVATVLRAGVPSLGIPAFFDQPFWCRRLATLGVAVPPLPRRALTVARLVASMTQLAHDARLAERARIVAETVRQESGVAAAVDAICADLAGSA